MKKFEKFAVFFILLFIISKIVVIFFDVKIASLISLHDYEEVSNFGKLLSITQRALHSIVNLSIAIWLFIVAKKDNSQPWIWAVMGYFFGLVSIGVYYIIRTYELLKLATQKNITKA